MLLYKFRPTLVRAILVCNSSKEEGDAHPVRNAAWNASHVSKITESNKRHFIVTFGPKLKLSLAFAQFLQAILLIQECPGTVRVCIFPLDLLGFITIPTGSADC